MAPTHRRQVIGSSYNEPLDHLRVGGRRLQPGPRRGASHCAYVSNGNATREVLDYLRPWVDAYKVDLKSMSEKNYRQLGGMLENVLETIRLVHEMGFWVEVVTLVVPGFNDSDEELREAARLPRRGLARHPLARDRLPQGLQDDRSRQHPAPTLLRAAEIGREEGLRYVYAGNLPGRVGDLENTYCPKCGELLVERRGLPHRPVPAGGRRPLPLLLDSRPGGLVVGGRRASNRVREEIDYRSPEGCGMVGC